MTLADDYAATTATADPSHQVLAPGVHAFVQLDGGWGLSNAGLVCSDDAVVLVDTWFTERRNDALRRMVMETAPIAPTHLVNTHHHGDHTYGNGWFPEATIISHEATREAVIALDAGASARRFTTVDFGHIAHTPASVTFEKSLQLHAGQFTLDVLFPGISHCVGNTVVFVREASVLFAGDILLKGCTPAFVGGSALGYLEVLEGLRQLKPTHVVPGHGALCGAEVIDETERYLRFVIESARGALANGQSPLEAARGATLGEFEDWIDSERIVGNLYRTMRELTTQSTGTPPSAPLDTHSMWRDTEAWLRRPLRSRA
ncbi:MAG: MBL fold metallo-hydrolase [Sciscionella sp.]